MSELQRRGRHGAAYPGSPLYEQAKELVGTTAQLEFRMVDDTNPGFFQEVFTKTPPPEGSNITVTNDEGFAQLQSGDSKAAVKTLKRAVKSFPAGTSPAPAMSLRIRRSSGSTRAVPSSE